MHRRTRKLIGTSIIVGFVPVYALSLIHISAPAALRWSRCENGLRHRVISILRPEPHRFSIPLSMPRSNIFKPVTVFSKAAWFQRKPSWR